MLTPSLWLLCMSGALCRVVKEETKRDPVPLQNAMVGKKQTKWGDLFIDTGHERALQVVFNNYRLQNLCCQHRIT